ncbi:MAG: putative glycoside hydrolase [Verrucomicrobiota bacterium]
MRIDIGAGLIVAAIQACCLTCGETVDRQEPAGSRPERIWRLPPTGKVTRKLPFLVNYHHRYLKENRVAQKEERLAQWDVLILHHFDVLRAKLSLERIRQTNPRIVILARMPLQGPGNPMQGRGVPEEGPGDWFARQADGLYLVPHWGGHLMNAVVQDYAWPRFVVEYLSREYLGSKRYDRVLFDCLWERPWPGMDVDGDGKADTPRDVVLWQKSMCFLLESVRRRFPEANLIGNGGGVWSSDCPYYAWTNGNMRENALGTQWGVSGWRNVWEEAEVGLGTVKGRPAYHFIAADVRFQRDQRAASELAALTDNDLRRLRLGLGLTLLRDGQYFGFDRGDCLHGQLWWFKEYDANLGDAVQPHKTGAFGVGTLSRVYESGIVVVNTTASSILINVPHPMRDATTEKIGRAFEIPGQDARILLRHP